MLDGWSPTAGAVPWRVGDGFYNAPANGPTAMLLARCGFRRQARQLADWIDDRLRLPGSDLIADGVHPGEVVQPAYFSYNQGVMLGVRLELGGERGSTHRLVAAIADHLARYGVLEQHGGGDGGLFTGILSRYLAAVAMHLPGVDEADRQARATAARLVLDSANHAWTNRATAPNGPVFGADWTVPAELPGRAGTGRFVGGTVTASVTAERDLSVQLSAWMLLEAAAVLTRHAAP